MTAYPHSTWFYFLSPHGLIMNPSLPLQSQILEPKRLESLMLRDKPVVPPDSVIRTFSHLKGDKIDLVITQDAEGLCQGSFVLRRGEWAKFFLDTWFDPLYRSYNFQKAEGHALVCLRRITVSLMSADDLLTGACRTMAPNNLNENGTCTPESTQFIWSRHRKPWRKRSHV